MIRIALLGLAIFIGGTSGISAQQRTTMGAGTLSCGQWLQNRSLAEHPGNSQELVATYQMDAWLDGYLSGTNVNVPNWPDIFTSRPSSIAMYAWVDNYCRSNPLDRISAAANALLAELLSRAKGK